MAKNDLFENLTTHAQDRELEQTELPEKKPEPTQGAQTEKMKPISEGDFEEVWKENGIVRTTRGFEEKARKILLGK